MPIILRERGNAEKYTVKADDTFEKIATEMRPDLDWMTLAKYNWGTAEPKESRRAICEAVGVKAADLRELLAVKASEIPHEKLTLKPDSNLAPKLKIPKAWKKEGPATEKTHAVKRLTLREASDRVPCGERWGLKCRQVLSMSEFKKIPPNRALQTEPVSPESAESPNQLLLFGTLPDGREGE